MAKKLTRDEIFTRSMKVRVLLQSHVTKLKEAASTSDIVAALKDKLDELGVDSKAVAFQLKHLSDNGFFQAQRKGRSVFYGGIKEKRAYTKKPKVDVKVKTTGKGSRTPDVKIKVSKSTGNVHITRGNMTIEIGFIE